MGYEIPRSLFSSNTYAYSSSIPIGVGDSVLSFVQSSSPTVGRELWLMVLRVSGSRSFQASHSLGNVLCPLLFILYTSEMFEQVENRLYAYADDSTLRAVALKPADRYAVAVSQQGLS